MSEGRMKKKNKIIHLTIYDGDGPNDETYDVKVKEGKKAKFWQMVAELCEADQVR